ncbi:MAG: hypothetical protein ORN58_07210 [Sediminibacterium sp.]|nr:hypothetical protein [Sediminibacterium sp.]
MLKLKSFTVKDSFVVTNFIRKGVIGADTIYNFLVPNSIKNEVYIINAFNYSNQLSDSIRLVRFFPNNIDSFGVFGWGQNGYGQLTIPVGLKNVVQITGGDFYNAALKADGTVVAWGQNSEGQTTIPDSLTDVVQIAGGASHVLALKGNGTIIAWGSNSYGKTSIPIGLNKVVQVAGGGGHSIALKADGTLVGWGDNYSGETTIPVGLNNVVQISAGSNHSLALKSDSTLVAWGYNVYGQASIPVGLNKVVKISSKNYYNLALKADSTVVAWGLNNHGQTTIPVGLNNVVQISAGDYHGLALKADSTVVAWGSNSDGQTTIPTILNKNVVQIIGGFYHSLALNKLFIKTSANLGGSISPTIFVKNGNSYKITYQPNWGYFVDSIFINGELNKDSLTSYTFNNIYQYQNIRLVFNKVIAPTKPRNIKPIVSNKKVTLTFLPPANFGGSRRIIKYIVEVVGTNIKDSSETSPITITGLTNLQSYNISIKAINFEGLVSDTALLTNVIPLDVAEIITIYRPAYKMGDSIQIRGNSIKTLKLKCFANKDSIFITNFTSKVAINNDTLYNFKVPNTVKNDVYKINAFNYKNQLSDSSGLVRLLPSNIDSLWLIGWGQNGKGQSTIPADLNNVVQIAAGEYHSLSLKENGTVVAWGSNSEGQISIPAGLNNVVQIAGGVNHSLSLKADGTVVAWGKNDFGQTTIPAGLKNVIQIAGGGNHSIALKDDGTVVVWGDSSFRQTTVPAGLNKVIQIAGGYYHTIALKEDGNIVAWGNNDFGQTTIPAGLNNVLQVSGGIFHSLALNGDSTVVTWGWNIYGQTSTLIGLNNVVQIAGGGNHNLSLKADGSIIAWGDNGNEQTSIPAGLNNVVQIAASGEHSLALNKLSIQTTANVGGLINPIILLKKGNRYRITYQANPGYFIDSVFINGVLNKDSLAGYTFYNVVQNQNVRVVFNMFTAPTKPRNVIAIGSNKKAIITFLPPANFGSRSIIKYITKIEGSNISDSSSKSPIIITGLTNFQSYNISIKAINNDGLVSDTVYVSNIIPIDYPEIISMNQPIYKIGDTIQLRGNSIYTLKLKSLAKRDSFFVTNFISKITINTDTLYNFIVPNTVKNDVYKINPISYSNQISETISLVRFFVIPKNIDSLGVIGWGQNGDGQRTIPESLTNVIQVAGGENHSLYLKGDGTVVGIGSNTKGQTTIPTGLNNVVQIAGGGNHSLALKWDGTIVAWGNNDYGQTTIPTGLNNVVQIAGGGNHSIALKGDGTIVSWGRNIEGQTTIPAGLNNVVQISGGVYHSLSLKKDGTIVAWGDNTFGQITIPVGLNNVIQIAGGGNNSIALNENGTVVAWGDNSYGQTSIPAGLNNVVQIAGGGNHNLALKGDGTVVAWGDYLISEPTFLARLNNVVQIAGGGYHSLLNFKGVKINTGVNIVGTISATKVVLVNSNYRVTYNPIINNIAVDSIFVNDMYDSAITKDSINGYTFTNINSNNSIKIVYKIPTYTINANAGNNGTISQLGISTIKYGETPTYLITPNVGYEIDNIFVNSIKINNVYSYTFDSIKSNQTILVTFKLQEFTISASTGFGGSISPQGTSNIYYGETPTYIITPNVGYEIDKIIINYIKINNVNNYTFDSIKSDNRIFVFFKVQTFTITATAGTGGSISPQGLATLSYGAKQTYQITPNVGYKIDSLIINGVKINNVNSYTFDSIKLNQTIRVTFKLDIACTGTKVTPNIVRVGTSLKSDITSFAKHRWYLDGTKLDSTIVNLYTPQTNGVYTLLGIDTNGCESNLSKKYYYSPTCITPSGRLGNGAFIQGGIIGNNNEIMIKWCTDIIQNYLTIQVLDINGVQVLEQKVTSNTGTYILNKQQIPAKKYIIQVVNNNGEVLQISDVINN